jgi:hypothetical protein
MRLAYCLCVIATSTAVASTVAAAEDDDTPAPPVLCQQASVDKRIACLDQLIFALSSRPQPQLRPVIRTEAECNGSSGCEIQCGTGEVILSAICVSDQGTLAQTKQADKAVCPSGGGLRGMNAICGK